MTSSFTAYWHILLECLIHLCEVGPVEARFLIRRYRSRLLNAPDYWRKDSVYHMEPWQLAQRLTGEEERQLTSEEKAWYEKIVRESTAEAAILGTEDEVREFQVI